MPPRIPWMTSSPTRRKKTKAMAVSLSLEWEGGGGSRSLVQLFPSPSPSIQGAHRPEISSLLPLEMARDLASTLIFSTSPLFLIHQHLLHT